jgi:hypothetical protein
MAADELSNNEIAQALFVTMKPVEVHQRESAQNAPTRHDARDIHLLDDDLPEPQSLGVVQGWYRERSRRAEIGSPPRRLNRPVRKQAAFPLSLCGDSCRAAGLLPIGNGVCKQRGQSGGFSAP